MLILDLICPGVGRKEELSCASASRGGSTLSLPDGKRGTSGRPATGFVVPADHSRSLHNVAFATVILGRHTQTCDTVGSAAPSGVASRPVAVGRPSRVRGQGGGRPGPDALPCNPHGQGYSYLRYNHTEGLIRLYGGITIDIMISQYIISYELGW